MIQKSKYFNNAATRDLGKSLKILFFVEVDVRKQILSGNSKQNRALISSWIGKSQKRFDQLFIVFLNEDYRVVQRAGGIVVGKAIECPGLLRKHFNLIIKSLKKEYLPIAIKRNILRLIPYTHIPTRYQGDFVETCMNYIALPRESATIKLCALVILQRIGLQYPEILPAIKITVHKNLTQQTPAFRAKAIKLIS